jgi:hypothetical protein
VGTANQITLAAGIPSTRTAAAGAAIYGYTTDTTRPIRCIDAYRRSDSLIDTSLNLIGRTDYDGQSQKASSGNPTQLCFEANLTVGTSNALHSQVRVWPVQYSSDCRLIHMLTEHYADDVDGATDNPQFPVEWANALIWNLAAEMAFEYGVDARQMALLTQYAAQKKANIVLSEDMDNSSVFLSPEAR